MRSIKETIAVGALSAVPAFLIYAAGANEGLREDAVQHGQIEQAQNYETGRNVAGGLGVLAIGLMVCGTSPSRENSALDVVNANQ